LIYIIACYHATLSEDALHDKFEVEVVVPEAAKLDGVAGSCIRGTGQYLRCNLQLHHKRSLHMELEFHCISSKLSYVVPVIAVLATVNEPETELFVMVLYSILILQHR
jgi:hypothetical protein